MKDIFHPGELKKKIIDTRGIVGSESKKDLLPKAKITSFNIKKVKRGSPSRLLLIFILFVIILIFGTVGCYYFIIKNGSSNSNNNIEEFEEEKLKNIDNLLRDLGESVESIDDYSEDEEVPALDLNISF